MVIMTVPKFNPGDIVQTPDGKLIVEVWADEWPEDPDTFTGCAFDKPEPFASSCMWSKDKFIPYQEPVKEYKPKSDKGYRVVSAVYRMLKRGRIKKDCAIDLIHKRGGVPIKTARGTVELWAKYPLKGLSDENQ